MTTPLFVKLFPPDAQHHAAARLEPRRQVRDIDARLAGKQGLAAGHSRPEEIHARRADEAGDKGIVSAD
ncbi:MAG: hypothetical protein E5W83_22320 [Mesorhizobium sp.]|nr:MAG: hypothetical protein E5W83_22320 [Mesorhizobium sp.]